MPVFDPALHPRLAAMLYIGAFIATTLIIAEISAYRKRRQLRRDRIWDRIMRDSTDD